MISIIKNGCRHRQPFSVQKADILFLQIFADGSSSGFTSTHSQNNRSGTSYRIAAGINAVTGGLHGFIDHQTAVFVSLNAVGGGTDQGGWERCPAP